MVHDQQHRGLYIGASYLKKYIAVDNPCFRAKRKNPLKGGRGIRESTKSEDNREAPRPQGGASRQGNRRLKLPATSCKESPIVKETVYFISAH